MDFYEIPGFKAETLSMWDQRATSALFLSLSWAAKTLVFINSVMEVSKEEMRLLFVYIFVMFKEGLEYPFLALAML